MLKPRLVFLSWTVRVQDHPFPFSLIVLSHFPSEKRVVCVRIYESKQTKVVVFAVSVLYF